MDRKEIIERLRFGNTDSETMNTAADLLAADGWVKVSEREPEPHGTYEVRRDGGVCTCTVCYGMHPPWWIAKVFGRDAEPIGFMGNDEWRPLPPEPDHG